MTAWRVDLLSTYFPGMTVYGATILSATKGYFYGKGPSAHGTGIVTYSIFYQIWLPKQLHWRFRGLVIVSPFGLPLQEDQFSLSNKLAILNF